LLERLPADTYDVTLGEVDGAESAGVLSEAFARVLRNALRDAYSNDNPERQVRFYNSLVQHLQSMTGDAELAVAIAEPPVRQLCLLWNAGRPAPSPTA